MPESDTDFSEEGTETPSSSVSDSSSTADHHDGQLGVDVYEAGDALFIKAMIAGVRKNDLDITITRETVTLYGSRYDDTPSDAYYVYQELYWGTFSRTIDLPSEVDIDQASAEERNGLLIIKLPKIDKQRSAKLEIR
jgi:HSP20 family protein